MGKTNRRRKRRSIITGSVVGVFAVLLVVGGFSLAAQSRQAAAERLATAAEAQKTAYRAQLEVEAAAEAQAAADAEAERVAGLLPLTWQEGRPLTFTLYGDSVALGQHSTVEATAYRSLTLSRLQEHGEVNFIGRYFAGARIADIDEKFTPFPNVDLTVLELGLNDAFKKTPIDEFSAKYRGYIDRIATNSPGTQLLCLGIWGNADEQNKPYSTEIESACTDNGGKYIDLSRTFADTSTHGPAGNTYWQGLTDNGHPNDKGHALIAQLILDRVPGLVPPPA